MDGVLAVNKQPGMSSAYVVKRLSRHLGIKKVGHSGSLDPFATGVLLICFGKGRKIVEYLMDQEKVYLATIRLGITTTTQDCVGDVVKQVDDFKIDKQSVESALIGFVGKIKQKAPIYSALKVNGVPMYKLARAGVDVERKERLVKVRSIELLDYTGVDVTIRVTCSRGTYIRTLGEDIGDALGVGGHLISLEREQTGKLSISQATRLDSLLSMSKEDVEKLIVPVGWLVDFLPYIVVDDEAVTRIVNGLSLGEEKSILDVDSCFNSGAEFRVLDQKNRFIATAICKKEDDKEFKDIRSKIAFGFKVKKVFSRGD